MERHLIHRAVDHWQATQYHVQFLKGNVSYLTAIWQLYSMCRVIGCLLTLFFHLRTTTHTHTHTHTLCSQAPLSPIHPYFIWHSEGKKKKTPYGISLEGKDKRRPLKWKNDLLWSSENEWIRTSVLLYCLCVTIITIRSCKHVSNREQWQLLTNTRKYQHTATEKKKHNCCLTHSLHWKWAATKVHS